jgi:GT2 family glycosyltransferase
MFSTHIIIVNYNAGDWLQRSVKSALNFSQGKVTVVDNASSDSSVSETQSIIQDTRLEWQLNDLNLGFAAANNQVLDSLEEDIAILMNPDCELNQDTLNAILTPMQVDSGIGMASCRILNEDGSLQASCRRRFPTPWSAFVRLLRLNRLFPNNPKFANFDYGDQILCDAPIEMVEAISGAFMVVRREALQQVGSLDEHYFMHCEDLDWCKRFELANWKVAFVPEAEVIHAKGVSSKSRPIRVLYTLHTGMNRFFDKFYKQEYSLPLRAFVKLGIAGSFVLRAAKTLVSK